MAEATAGRPAFTMDEDELGELIPAQTAAPAAATTTSTAFASWGADDNDDVSSSILKSSGPAYIKVAENQPARIAFVPGVRIYGAPVHYDSVNKKYWLCTQKAGVLGSCCKKFGDNAKGRAAAFCYRYTNADPATGKLAAGTIPQVEVNIFVMSRSNFEDVRGAVEEGSSVYGVDFRISVTAGQLTRKVAVISRVARYLEIKEQALALAAPFLAQPEMLTRALGRTYTGSHNFPNGEPSMEDVAAL